MSKSKFFTNPSEPTRDITAMLVHLDDAGHITKEMRDALRQHADNALSTIPRNIATLARAVAAASDGGWMDKSDVSSAAYGLAELAEKLEGFQSMQEHFS